MSPSPFFILPEPRRSAPVGSFDALEDSSLFLDAFSLAGVHTLSPLAWMLAEPLDASAPRRVGIILPPTTHAGECAAWATLLAAHGACAALPIAPARIDEEDASSLRVRDLSAMLGLGLVPIASGWTGAPLVGLDPGALRHELESAQRFFTDATGFRARVLAPAHDDFGVAVDALVLQEAWRAGFRLVLTEPLQPLRQRPSHHEAARRLEGGIDTPARVVADFLAKPSRLRDVTTSLGALARRGRKIGRHLLDDT